LDGSVSALYITIETGYQPVLSIWEYSSLL